MDKATTSQPDLESPEGSAHGELSEGRMGQIIEKAASWLGNTIAFLANSGILFIIFALIWTTFGVALIWSQGSLDAAWQWVRDLHWLAQGLVWLLFLPVMLGLWIWETSWSFIVRLILIVGIAGWTLLVFPKPWKLDQPGVLKRQGEPDHH